MSDTPNTAEPLALARRGLPLPRAQAALPRVPWWPAALCSHAEPATPLSFSGAAADVALDDSASDASVRKGSDKISWRDEAFSLSCPEPMAPAARRAGSHAQPTAPVAEMSPRAASAPAATAASSTSAGTNQRSFPQAAASMGLPSPQTARVNVLASRSEPMGPSRTLLASAAHTTERATIATASVAPVVVQRWTAAPPPSFTVPSNATSSTPPERLPRSVLATLPSASPTNASAAAPATPVIASGPGAASSDAGTESARSLLARPCALPVDAAPRMASATRHAAASPVAMPTPAMLPAATTMGWPQASNDGRARAAPPAPAAPMLTTAERQALLAPQRTEPQGVHIGQVHVTVQAPAAATPAAAAAVPAPRSAAPAAHAVQPAPYRNPWAGAYRRRD